MPCARTVLCLRHHRPSSVGDNTFVKEPLLSFSFAFILPTTRCEVRCDFCFYQTGHSPRVEEVDYLEPLDQALDALYALKKL